MTAPSFHDVYVREREFVWRTLRRFGIPERHLEDLMHDVFLNIHKKLDTYDPARPLRPWIYVFAMRAASRFRSDARNARVDLTAELDATAGARNTEAEVSDRQAAEIVERFIASLDDDQRAVFVLHDVEEQAMPAIAAELGVPLNTAYSRLRLAREKLAAVASELKKTRRSAR